MEITKEELRSEYVEMVSYENNYGGSKYTDKKAHEIAVKHIKENKSYREIEKETGLNYRTAQRWVKKYLGEEGDV